MTKQRTYHDEAHVVQTIGHYIKEGKVISGVKLLRDTWGYNLKEAYDYANTFDAWRRDWEQGWRDARRVLFLIDDKGRAISATVLDGLGDPVDGFTNISANVGLDYLINHPDAMLEKHQITEDEKPWGNSPLIGRL